MAAVAVGAFAAATWTERLASSVMADELTMVKAGVAPTAVDSNFTTDLWLDSLQARLASKQTRTV